MVFGFFKKKTKKSRGHFVVKRPLGLPHDLIPTAMDPRRPNPQQLAPGYKATDVQIDKGGMKATLVLDGEPPNSYGVDLQTLELKVTYQTKERVRVTIQPMELDEQTTKFYNVPPGSIPDGSDTAMEPDNGIKPHLIFNYSNEPTFWFSVRRRDEDEDRVIFSTENTKLIYQNQFLEFRTLLPQDHRVFGLGETIDDFRIKPGTVRTLHNADIPDKPGANLYGTHPVYLEERYDNTNGNSSSKSHIVYLRNCHTQEVTVEEKELCWRSLGGNVDLYFFSGPTTIDAIRQYQYVIGLPAMQQYWTLGHHHSRWGLSSAQELVEVANKYREQDIPIETIWSDLDYMDKSCDFILRTPGYSQEAFSKALGTLHNYGMKYVPLVDAAIFKPPSNSPEAYLPYSEGKELDVFVKNHTNSEYYVGNVWPGPSVFPDWYNQPNTYHWWAKQLKIFHGLVPYDGIWLDMNEVASFHTQESDSSVWEKWEGGNSIQTGQSTVRNVINPPYAINNSTESGKQLSTRTLPMDAIYSNGYVEYDCHNLWGYEESKNTYKVLSSEIHPGKRPFIISRSTFAGSGSFVGHWGGDNYSQWRYLKYSISQGLSFSIFGIPMFGPDVCGFIGDADDELCIRWCQLASFFSFFRNHNHKDAIPQEFYRSETVSQAARKIMNIRYRLLPYFYTLLYKACSEGDPFLRALSWEFTKDKYLSGIDTQYMVGPSVMVAPVLEKGSRSVEAVFPSTARWYDWHDMTLVKGNDSNEPIIVDAPLDRIPIYIKGGSILALQEPKLTTWESRRSPWELIIALDEAGYAEGELYMDDGVSVQPKEKLLITFYAQPHIVKWQSKGSTLEIEPLSKVTILGLGSRPDKLSICDKVVPPECIRYYEGELAASLDEGIPNWYDGTLTWV